MTRAAPRALRVLRSAPVRFVALFVLLMLPWPGLGRAYGALVEGMARATVAPAAAPVTLGFSRGATEWQLVVRAEDPASGRYVGTALDLRRAGYIASALFTALALATPLASRRRWLALLAIGLGALQVLPLLPLVWFLSGKLPVQAFQPGALAGAAVEIAYHVLVTAPGMAYAVPALLWLLLVWLLDGNAIARAQAQLT